MWPKTIPKVIHFYWSGAPLTYLRYLCFYSFRKFHPDWKMKLYMPKYPCISNNLPKTRDLNETSNIISYVGPNYYEKLTNLNIEIISVDFESATYNFKNETTDDYQATFLKYFLMAGDGGVWSNTDIIFVKSMDQLDFSSKHIILNQKTPTIDIGIAFYSNKQMPHGCYYTSFVFSSGKNSFFANLTNEVRKRNFTADQYLSLDQHLSLDQILFGETYPNIQAIVSQYPQYNIYNIDQSSIYSYTLFQLNDLYNKQYSFRSPIINIKDYNFGHGVIGFHWFGGAALSEIYENSIDTLIKPSGYSFEGFLPQLVNIYKKETQMITQDVHDKYIKCSQSKKISIVMSYHNRKSQLLTTLKTIMKSNHKNYEIIIVDDGSDENHRIEDLVDLYHFQLIRIEKNQKYYCNSCIPYNLAFKKATGTILLIQNPECCHIGDILAHVQNNLTENDYITYSCLSLPSDQENKKLSDILFHQKWLATQSQGPQSSWTKEQHLEICEQMIIPNIQKIKPYIWYNHPIHNPSKLHFMSAIYKSHIDQIGGFDENYSDGYCFDDNEFLRRIEYQIGLKTHIVPLITQQYSVGMKLEYNVYCFHQYHDVIFHDYTSDEGRKKYDKNQRLFIQQHKHILVDHLNNKLGNPLINLLGYSHQTYGKTQINKLGECSFQIWQKDCTQENQGFRVSVRLPKDVTYSANSKRHQFEEKMEHYYQHYNKVIKFKCRLASSLPRSVSTQKKSCHLFIFNGITQIPLGIIDQLEREYQYIGPLINNHWRLFIANIINANEPLCSNKTSAAIRKVSLTKKLVSLESLLYISYIVTDLQIFCQIKNLTVQTFRSIWRYPKIPKIAFTYWAGKLTKLHYLGIKNLLRLNPDWEVILYQPTNEYTREKTWTTNEHSIKYQGKDYRQNLLKLNNLKIINIDLQSIGFYNNVPEVFKSNYVTCYYLSTAGGVWFDTDIFFIRPLNDLHLSQKMVYGHSDSLEVVVSQDSQSRKVYFSTGILMSSKNNSFYNMILSELKKRYDPKIYMSAANSLYLHLFKNVQGIHKVFPELNYADLGMDIFYPFKWNEMNALFFDNKEMHRVTEKVIGIHWYNGSTITEKFLNENNYESDVLINRIIKKYRI